MPTKKYKVQSGDSWIKIANKLGVNLRQLFKWNDINPDPNNFKYIEDILNQDQYPWYKEGADNDYWLQAHGYPFTIHPGQWIYASSPYMLDAAKVIADAPKDYIDYGDMGKQMLTNYALAVKQGKLRLNEVPEEFQGPVLQKTQTLTTDEAANYITQNGINLALFLTDPIGYTIGYGIQKGAAYGADKISGRNEYGVDDLTKFTPIKGREYAAEHPWKSMLLDAGVGAGGSFLIRNAGNLARYGFQNARQAAQNALATTGMQRYVDPVPVFDIKTKYGSIFTDGTKGVGKTGTIRAGGRSSGGYRPVSSPKGTFSHNASGNTNLTLSGYTTPSSVLPIKPLGNAPELLPGLGPIHWGYYEPEINVIRPKHHIFERQSFDRWQAPMQEGWIKTSRFDPTLETNYTITGEAPIGNSIYDQALTKESLITSPGWTPRKASYVNGAINGTPSSIFSGLGITYGTNNPGNLIVK